MSEDKLIAWLRRELARRGNRMPGDDTAFLPAAPSSIATGWAVTVDQQIEGTHYPAGTPAQVVARRLIAVNLSDLAAAGARPAYGLLAMAAPPDYPFKTFYRAFLGEADRHGLQLAGGDVARSERPHFSLTVFGGKVPGGHWLRRGAGRAGDSIWVGGTLGESAAGRLLLAAGARLEGRRVELPRHLRGELEKERALAKAARRAVRRHLAPEAQLGLGEWLARRRRAAAIDVSDGLLLDLGRLCGESGVGAEMDAVALPLPAGFDRLAPVLGADPLDLALSGGEDYVLAFTLPATVRPSAEFGCSRVGRLVPRRGVRLLGVERAAPARPGWDHLA